MFYLICAWTNGWVNNRDAGDLRRHWAQYDVTVMVIIEPNCAEPSANKILTENLDMFFTISVCLYINDSVTPLQSRWCHSKWLLRYREIDIFHSRITFDQIIIGTSHEGQGVSNHLNASVTAGLPSQKASTAKEVSISWRHYGYTFSKLCIFNQRVMLPRRDNQRCRISNDSDFFQLFHASIRVIQCYMCYMFSFI